MEGSELSGSHPPSGEKTAEALALWYDLARLYSRAASASGRSARLGFTVTLVSGALVLLSAPLFGTAWAGVYAPLVPLLLGVSVGLFKFFLERTTMRRREASVAASLAALGLDAGRPGANGLAAYYDAQLILLRSEYEYLLGKGAGRSAKVFENSFGFTPEDDFGAGPLTVEADSPQIAELRKRWERRMRSRKERAPGVGLREDRAYRFYPREMTIGAERVVREACLTISLELARKRYGKDFSGAPEKTGKQVGREAEEYRRLTGRKP